MLSIWSLGRHLLGSERWVALDVIAFPITSIALLGLIAYAFSLKVFTERFWAGFQSAFLGWIMFSLRPIWAGNAATGIKIGAIAIIVASMGFNWLALYRLAGSPWSSRIKRRI
jgi:hypothetical protein